MKTCGFRFCETQVDGEVPVGWCLHVVPGGFEYFCCEPHLSVELLYRSTLDEAVSL